VPELPEVETIVRGLANAIVGKTIEKATVRLPKMAVAPERVHFKRAVRGERVVSVSRRGKFSVISLASGRSAIVSLRMTGRLVVLGRGQAALPYEHVSLHFTDGTRLAFADSRQFGRMRLVERGELWDAGLGVEP